MTGNPLSFISRALSVSAMVFDGRSAATRGLRVWSTSARVDRHPARARR